jgi:predicted ATPase/DNA-binding XRE family transcriptional regulator
MAEATFANLLRQYRLDAGLSQEQLAERANLSLRGISDLERAVRKAPYRPTVAAIARALNLQPAEAKALEECVDRSRQVRATTAPRGMPRPVSSLIGREEALAEVCELLLSGRARLVTLLGPGGVGKTRVALEVGRRTSESHGLRTVLVRLEEVHADSGVIPALATELGISRRERRPALDLVAASLFGETTLVILDNFEHLLDAAPDVVDVLERCPNLTVLVTSRAALNVRGEHEYPIPTLDLPLQGHQQATESDLSGIAESPSVQLILERMRERSPGLVLAGEDWEDVREIVCSLDGLPLALELAAARSTALSLKQIRESLASRLTFLTSGPQDLPGRQRTLRDTIAWSYELLNAQDQRLFRQLSVLRGAWSLDLAADVVEVDGETPLDSRKLVRAEQIASLVRQSLLIRLVSQGGNARYRMLELTREFAGEELARAGEADEAKERLLAAILRLTGQARRGLNGPDMEEWCDRLDLERENIHAALAWALESGSFDPAADLLFSIRSWFHASSSGWVGAWIEEAIADPRLPENAPARARLLAIRAFLYAIDGRSDDAGFASLNDSLPVLHAMENQSDFAYTVVSLIRFHGHRLRSEDLHRLAEQGLEAFKSTGNSEGMAAVLIGRASSNLISRRLGETEADCNEVIALGGVVDPVNYSSALLYLACVRILRGDLAAARSVLEHSTERLPERFMPTAQLYVTRARISQRLMEESRAASEYRDTLMAVHSTGGLYAVPLALEGAAWLAFCNDRYIEAARLLGAAESLPPLGHGRFDSTRDRDEVALLVRQQLGETAWTAAVADGSRLTLERAIAEALEEIEENIEPVTPGTT